MSDITGPHSQIHPPLDWSADEQRTLGRFLRYNTAHANTVARCRKALEDDRKARLAEKIMAKNPTSPKSASK